MFQIFLFFVYFFTNQTELSKSAEMSQNIKDCIKVSSSADYVPRAFYTQYGPTKNAWCYKEPVIELVSEELDHLAAILHGYARGLIFMK